MKGFTPETENFLKLEELAMITACKRLEDMVGSIEIKSESGMRVLGSVCLYCRELVGITCLSVVEDARRTGEPIYIRFKDARPLLCEVVAEDSVNRIAVVRAQSGESVQIDKKCLRPSTSTVGGSTTFCAGFASVSYMCTKGAISCVQDTTLLSTNVIASDCVGGACVDRTMFGLIGLIVGYIEYQVEIVPIRYIVELVNSTAGIPKFDD